MRIRLRRSLTTTLIALLAAAAALSPQTAQGAPGSPGVPQAPATPVFFEGFQNQTATNGIRIGQYTGGPASNASTYLTSPNWAPTADQCNGWILRSTTPRNATVTNIDSGCDPTAWSFLQGMGTAIGLYRGDTLATAQQNQILSEYTNGGSNPGPGVEFQTAKPITGTIIPGHFYQISAIYGAANCVSEGPGLNRQDPLLTFNLITNQTGSGPAPGTGGGTVTTLASGLNPCTDQAARVIATGGHSYHVARLNSAGFRMPPGVTSLGIQLFNAAGSFRGNDSGFDDPTIVDATPQLDKEFSPTTLPAGQNTTLTFTITNTDELAAKNGWSFTDTLPTGLAFAGAASTDCPAGTSTINGNSISGSGNLDADMVSCTFTVPVTSSTPGTFTNGPSNIGPLDGLLMPGSSTVVFTQPDVPAISLVKSASLTSPSQFVAGAPVTYSYVATNTGNVPLTDVTLTETEFSGTGTPTAPSCPQDTLAVQESMTCTSTYVVTQADVDAGEVTNTANVSGTPPSGPNVTDESSTVISGSATPAISLVKTADASGVNAPAEVDDPIDYTITATNTGNVTLTNVTISDTLLGGDISYTWPGTPGVLAPNQSVTATGTHLVTAADINAGLVTNTATTSGQDPDGDPVTTDPASTTTPLTPGPHLTLEKTATPSFGTPPRVGDLVTFNFTITNDGNLTLTDVAITDRLPGLSSISYNWPGTAGVLAAGQSATASATYPITQADINAGEVLNTAVANGRTPARADTPSNEADTDTPIPRASAISLVKTADASQIANPAVVGNPIVYHFTITNTGNTDLSNVKVTDQLSGLGTITYSWPGADGVLTPNQSATATASYPITQADINSGTVTNTAVATGNAPDDSTPTSPPQSTTTPLEANAAMTLVKSASPNDAASFVVGQVITYSFVVTNTGTLPLSNVSIVESDFSGTGTLPDATCPGGTLEPGQQITCTAEYTLTQGDVDAGELTNTAHSTGTPPDKPPVTSNDSSTLIPAPPEPALSLVKTADVQQVTKVGQQITYTYKITNTGNVTMTDVGVTESRFTGAGTAPVPECPATAESLAPGESVLCIATYTVVAADLNGDKIINVATAHGTPPGSPPITTTPSTASVDTATVTTPPPVTPPAQPGVPFTQSSGPLPSSGSPVDSRAISGALAAVLLGIALMIASRGRVAPSARDSLDQHPKRREQRSSRRDQRAHRDQRHRHYDG